MIPALIKLVLAANPITGGNSMSFQLPALPYSLNALEPYVSENTLNFHHGKHHFTYVNKLNDLIKGTSFEGMSLESIIKETCGQADLVGIFNNAAQTWNHTFLWKSMKPKGGGVPTGEVLEKIEEAFETYEDFKNEFIQAGMSQFGSGWVWLVQNDEGQFKIVKTGNAETPLSCATQTPLMTCDVWEHAYYLDYQNRRNDYLNTFINHLVSWDFVAENMKK